MRRRALFFFSRRHRPGAASRRAARLARARRARALRSPAHARGSRRSRICAEEYEKLHRALKKSHESEKRLIKKCRELNAEIVSNASKVQTALKLSQEDQVRAPPFPRPVAPHFAGPSPCGTRAAAPAAKRLLFWR